MKSTFRFGLQCYESEIEMDDTAVGQLPLSAPLNALTRFANSPIPIPIPIPTHTHTRPKQSRGRPMVATLMWPLWRCLLFDGPANVHNVQSWPAGCADLWPHPRWVLPGGVSPLLHMAPFGSLRRSLKVNHQLSKLLLIVSNLNRLT